MTRVKPEDVKHSDRIYVKEWGLEYSGSFCHNFKHGLLLKGIHTLYRIPDKYKITWNNGFVQYKSIAHKTQYVQYSTFTVESPIFQAILDQTYFIDLGYGKFSFKIEEL